jgi:hypothetical protein
VIERYLRAQLITKTTSIGLGLQIDRTYQRNSGLPDTAPFNTLVRLATVADIIAQIPRDKILSIALLGDDLLIHARRCVEVLDATDALPGLLAALYNLTSKVFSNNVGYFCGFYIVHLLGQIFLAADPIRRMVKLGRSDLDTEEKISEYYTSFRDNLVNYDNELIKAEVARGVAERYVTRDVDITPILDCMSALADNYSLFRTLWSTELTVHHELQ